MASGSNCFPTLLFQKGGDGARLLGTGVGGTDLVIGGDAAGDTVIEA